MGAFYGLGFSETDILLPKDVDMSKWAVVACDQFTSQPEYWQEADRYVGDAVSTLRLILPESHLNDPDVAEQIDAINRHMAEYIQKGVFTEYPDAVIYVERTQSDGTVRKGIIGAVDLDDYDYTPGSGALIRATEGTILSRIPPRVKVRENAEVELPHIMLLLDDPEKKVIEPLQNASDMKVLYDFDLMQGGGHVKGMLLTDAQKDAMAAALRSMCSSEEMERKYGLAGEAPLLFAVGDGNHSLATAKTCYENLKKVTPESEWKDLAAGRALVEVENIHDEALVFEPIHRVLTEVDPAVLMEAFRAYYPNACEGEGNGHVIEYIYEGHEGKITVPDSSKGLPVGTLQDFLDHFLKENSGEIDYIHGDDVVKRLGVQKNSIGFILPPMGKQEFFRTIVTDGVLPRKTFSMGNAADKRYYIEARKIR